MFEYTILVPATDGLAAWLPLVEQEALSRFGGFTAAAPVRGAWINPETREVEFDTSVPFIIAGDPTAVRAFAYYVGRLLKQHTVYLRHPDGHVEFVPTFVTQN